LTYTSKKVYAGVVPEEKYLGAMPSAQKKSIAEWPAPNAGESRVGEGWVEVVSPFQPTRGSRGATSAAF